MRTITVAQPSLTRSALSLAEVGGPSGGFAYRGLRKRSAELELAGHRATFETVGLLGRTIKVYDDEGGALGEFRQSPFSAKGQAAIGGVRYRLRTSGMLTPRFFWVDSDGTEVVSVKLGGVVRTNGVVEVADIVAPGEAPALVGLALLAALSVADGDAGVGAVTSSSG